MANTEVAANNGNQARDPIQAHARATALLLPSLSTLLIALLYVAFYDAGNLKWLSTNAILVGIGIASVVWLVLATYLTRLVAVRADPRTITELYERWQELSAQLDMLRRFLSVVGTPLNASAASR